MKPLAWLALCCWPCRRRRAAELSPAERRIGRTVEAEQARTIRPLQRLVDRNSGTLNLEGVAMVGAMMRAELEPLGFAVRWDMREKPDAPVMSSPPTRGAARQANPADRPSRHRVRDRPAVPALQPRRQLRARVFGVGDDKGGLAVIVAALRAMHAAGTLRDADIEVVLTGDEERPGSPIAGRAPRPDRGGRRRRRARVRESARDDGRDFGTVARRSSTSWTLRTAAAPAIRAASSAAASATARSTSWRGSSTASGANCPSPTSPTMSA